MVKFSSMKNVRVINSIYIVFIHNCLLIPGIDIFENDHKSNNSIALQLVVSYFVSFSFH